MSLANRPGNLRVYPVKAGAVIEGNATVILVNGIAEQYQGVASSSDNKAAGVSVLGVDNTNGAAGEQQVSVDATEHQFKNSGDIDYQHVGSTAYFSADDTVSIGHATNTYPTAGVITEVSASKVWVQPGV